MRWQKFGDDDRAHVFIGDVRDKDRLYRALDGVDYVVCKPQKIEPHRRILNPFECVKQTYRRHEFN